MIRLARVLIAIAVLGATWLVVELAPRGLRRLEMFDVRTVDVRGTRYLAVDDAIAALRLPPGASVFDDAAPWRDAILEHPLVENAEIQRRPISTLVVHVTEKQPIAFASTPALRPVAADATVLPIDLAAAGLDLPVLLSDSPVAEEGRLESQDARDALGTLQRIRQVAPELFDRVSDAEPVAGGGLRVRLRDPVGLTALVPAMPVARDLDQLELALDELAAGGELDQVRLVDARFRDQVVVSSGPDARR